MPYSPEPQVFPYQAEACQSPETEPSYSSMDSLENRQHHQVMQPIPVKEIKETERNGFKKKWTGWKKRCSFGYKQQSRSAQTTTIQFSNTIETRRICFPEPEVQPQQSTFN
ncbi:hypothetical protein LOZ57_001008 [Ophidiomyces ophidiicola]|uniref:uncharacterized protein n=1 Tax=Ophidiomyces ophidiicola TaxID=1387563 RepID=UPI0020C3E49D|nr:uncharacterized protein LOZ57_001008 [Ophidiomyces ophidiicola]KAI1952924.1 hypothetical protein LOZ57_001008 [Ophidiomyces ophidiicola]KAI2057571.1 hypothetical protein LOZ43_003034 [Ophidiomyces ophidiicola]